MALSEAIIFCAEASRCLELIASNCWQLEEHLVFSSHRTPLIKIRCGWVHQLFTDSTASILQTSPIYQQLHCIINSIHSKMLSMVFHILPIHPDCISNECLPKSSNFKQFSTVSILDIKSVKAEKNTACKLIFICRQTDLDIFYWQY